MCASSLLMSWLYPQLKKIPENTKVNLKSIENKKDQEHNQTINKTPKQLQEDWQKFQSLKLKGGGNSQDITSSGTDVTFHSVNSQGI